MTTPEGDITLDQLRALAAAHLPAHDLPLLEAAGAFAQERHGDKPYNYGGTFLQHATAVAATLASMRMDVVTITAGLLHGVVNEGVATQDEVLSRFGPGVANIVGGVTRITRVRYSAQAAGQVENIRKYILAMGSDIRVLLVKLADRFQDMLKLSAAAEEERRYKARETMDLYAPLAARVGIEWMKRELEDLAFSFLWPEDYARLAGQMDSTLDERQAYVNEVIGILHDKLAANRVDPVRIIGRPKHLYSIHKKLVAQKITVDRVYDKVAFRIIVRTVRECYQALGTVHAEWAPVPGRIKDFISTPKANNYQSLHTTVAGPRGHFIEIQIRTEEMDRVAQEGVAAHWAYKEGQRVSQNDARLFKDIKQLVKNLQEVDDPTEFMESLKQELFEPDVFALTPKGEVRALPRGSTPIDFAYAIHSDIGDTCVGAKVNGRIVPLKYKLQHGDIVEILTQKNERPKRAWLQIAQTTRARNRIRQYLRKEERQRSLRLGRELCERELRKNGLSLHGLAHGGRLHSLLKDLRCSNLEDMLIKVGAGVLGMPALLRALLPEGVVAASGAGGVSGASIASGGPGTEAEETRAEDSRRHARHGEPDAAWAASGAARVEGVPDIDMPMKLSRCCRPIPGDAIVGFITTGSGLSIHRAECPNLLATNPSRWVEVVWPEVPPQGCHSAVVIRAEHRRGLVADISAAVSADDADIAELHTRTNPQHLMEMEALLTVRDLDHLNRVLLRLRRLSGVQEARRR